MEDQLIQHKDILLGHHVSAAITQDESMGLEAPIQSNDWAYNDRRDMQEILPNVFLGPFSSAMKSKLDDLVCAGITHIVCIRQSIEAHFVRPNFPQRFSYLVLDICDRPTENIIPHFTTARKFINDCLNSGGKVLVHGNGGISRSAAILVAYVMETNAMSFGEALCLVRSKRFCISINEGFLQQLMEYEHIYKARQQMGMANNFYITSSASEGKRKRFEFESPEESNGYNSS